jgi:hypothetical protein
MSTMQTIGVRDFMNKFLSDENVFNVIPEFTFIKPVAQRLKAQKCTCGLNQEIARATLTFNDFVEHLEQDVVNRVATVFGANGQVCFGLQRADQSFEVKCYSTQVNAE